jgi:hypothetical protein
MLEHVFLFLDTKSLTTAVPGVCKRWRSVCFNRQGVHINLGFVPPKSSPLRHTRWAGLQNMGLYMQQHYVSLTGARSKRCLESLEAALARFKHVVSVDLTDFGDDVAVTVANSCPLLRSVVVCTAGEEDEPGTRAHPCY